MRGFLQTDNQTILGSSASRSQSPTKLIAITVTTIASPGNSESHQALSTYWTPSKTMRPHVGVGGGTPSPRKLRLASKMIILATISEAITMTDAETLGRTCRITIRDVDA